MAAHTATQAFTNVSVTVNTWGVPQGVRFEITADMLGGLTHASPLRVENVVFQLDGEYAFDVYQASGMPRTANHTLEMLAPTNTRQIYRGHLRTSLLKNRSRGTRTFTAALFDAAGQGKRIGDVSVPTNLNAYSDKDVIVRSMFNLSHGEIVNTSGLLTEVRNAGINTLWGGLFENPAFSGAANEAAWAISSLDNKFRPQIDYCLNNGFYYRALGDDFTRIQQARDFINNSPFAASAIQRTAYVAQSYGGVMPFMDVMDEIDRNPTGAGSDPADLKLITNWRLHGGPAINWPAVETQTVYPTPWEQPAYADMVNRYPAPLHWTTARADGFTFSQYEAGVHRVRPAFKHESATHYLPAGWKAALKLDCSGPYYTKLGPGGNYNPATDTLHAFGWRPELVTSQPWIGLAYGFRHFHYYMFDTAGGKASRLAAAIPTAGIQTGSSPGDARWSALSAGYGSVARYESRLLNSKVTSRRDGPWLTAWNYVIRWAINISESSQGGQQAGGRLVTNTTGAAGTPYNGGAVPPGGVVVWEL